MTDLIKDEDRGGQPGSRIAGKGAVANLLYQSHNPRVWPHDLHQQRNLVDSVYWIGPMICARSGYS